ncbi:MAG: enoyl-CoA hydratase-related protein [Myxococcales bacterium]|nr:enoyl-CoA hydratase-related protein [Myxococcales bacterium]
MDFETLTMSQEGALARITLNRPDAFNALNLKMALELREAVRHVEMDESVRALLLTGAGKAFCAGGDVASFHGALPMPEQLIKDIVLPMHDAIAIMTHMDKPVVVAINGVAAGAGMGLAMAPDIAIASEKAKFSMAYTGIAAAPDGSTTFYLPRLVGLRRALELTLENRVLSAQEAMEWGLANQVVPPEELEAAALERARKLAVGPTRALGMAKRLLHRSFESSLETQLMREGRGIASMGSTEDFAEGVTAFVEKRDPEFQGR